MTPLADIAGAVSSSNNRRICSCCLAQNVAMPFVERVAVIAQPVYSVLINVGVCLGDTGRIGSSPVYSLLPDRWMFREKN
jgi:hypothetical protein